MTIFWNAVVDLHIFDSLGNKRLLPVFIGSGPSSKRARREDSAIEGDCSDALSEGFVIYKGSLLDIGKLVDQLKRTEKALLQTETKLIEVQHENNILNDKSNKKSNTIKDLSEEVKSFKDKSRNDDEKLKKVMVNIYFKINFLSN